VKKLRSIYFLQCFVIRVDSKLHLCFQQGDKNSSALHSGMTSKESSQKLNEPLCTQGKKPSVDGAAWVTTFFFLLYTKLSFKYF
jgi:hypothetical protein